MLSPDVIGFLQSLLGSLTIQTSDPGFRVTAAMIARAQDELAALAPPPIVLPDPPKPKKPAPRRATTPRKTTGRKKAAPSKRTGG